MLVESSNILLWKIIFISIPIWQFNFTSSSNFTFQIISMSTIAMQAGKINI